MAPVVIDSEANDPEDALIEAELIVTPESEPPEITAEVLVNVLIAVAVVLTEAPV
jgi:hypothetical protein